ncbi:hypothetical protein D9758_010256 [Tetrapyrgos nigripes]|uniref:Uncharacterized protein n=1 Tax=Tetrapyrgos nigripes TaxID=182062 RepID=A0A8H5GA85_9AGAR|nr:hypothetical protein D9758_010256 [Tetrapyrgos nigripes]
MCRKNSYFLPRESTPLPVPCSLMAYRTPNPQSMTQYLQTKFKSAWTNQPTWKIGWEWLGNTLQGRVLGNIIDARGGLSCAYTNPPPLLLVPQSPYPSPSTFS